ncbi:MAG TPA: CBS domain-containing protein [Candidatus Acidoferrales bacterium]
MRVQDVMMRTPVYCSPETNLGSAVQLLWDRDCGFLPIVDAKKRLIGVVTDRDLCVALGTRHQPAGRITVGEVASGKVYSCKEKDDIHAALQTMAEKRVRRLPVVNEEGVLQGILSMDNVVLHTESAGRGHTADLSDQDVVNTLRQIYGPLVPQVAGTRSARA